MRYFIAIVLLLGVFTASAQKNKFKGAGFDYTKTAPNYIPVRGTESEIAIDSLTGKWMQYSYQSAEWWHLGYFVTETGTSGSPSYTPNKVKSVMAINAGDSLYHYRSGTWYLIAGGGGGAGITDGDKGDVDVIGGGTVWTIDTGAVTMIKINQDGAAVGQVIKWNGTTWAPANDNTLSAGAGGIYGPRDLVTYHHTATVDSGLTFSSAEDTAYFNIIMAPGAFGSAAYFNSDSIRLRRYDVGGSNEVILNSDGVLLKTTTPDRVTIQGADARSAADYRATYSARSFIDKQYGDDFYLQEVDSLRVSNDTLYISLARDSVPEKFVVLPASDDTSGYNLDFRISNDTLYIEDSDGALFVDLEPYRDNTDTSGYNLGARISGDTLYIRDGDGEVSVELPTDSDGQTLSIDSVSLESGERFIITISNGNAISFDVPADTDNQTLDTFEIVSNVLRASLTDDGVPFKSVDMTPYLDNTDAQTLSVDSTDIGGIIERFEVSISNGNSVYIDVPQVSGSGAGQNNVGANLGAETGVYAGKTDTILQFKSLVEGYGIDLSNTSTEITIRADTAQLATLHDVAVVQDDIDSHELADGDLDDTNELQSLTIDSVAITGKERFLLEISDGNTVYIDVPQPDGTGTDDQTLVVDSTSTTGGQNFELEIEDGNTVAFFIPTDTDEQDLSIDSVNITDKERFTIDITDGASVSFDVDINTDTQDLSIDSASTTGGQNFTIGLTDGGSVSLFVPTDTDTDEQTLVLDSTDLTGIERYALGITDGNTVYFDDDDRQTLDTFEIVSNILRASATEDGVPFKSVDLSSYVNPAIALDHIAIGTGTSITQDYAIQANRTATDGQESKIRLSMKDAGITDHAIVIDSVLSTNLAYVVDITNPSSSAGSGYFFPYRARYTGSAAVDLYSVLSSSSTNSGADVFMSLGTASGGGDPAISFSSGVTNNQVIIGVDNSSTGDLFLIDYLTTGGNMDGTYALSVNNGNLVGIGGAPVTGKALAVTGELAISDLNASTTATVVLGADGSGNVESLGLSGLSVSSGTLTATDPSLSNEGTLGVSAGASNTSVIISNTSGATGVTVTAGIAMTISESTSSNGGTITLNADTTILATIHDVAVAGGTDTNIYTTDGNIKDGGTVVDVSGNDPIILALDNATTEQNRMLRLTFDHTDDVTNTYGISFVGPNDSLEIRSYDSGMYLDYEGVTSSGEGFVISSNTVLDLRGDSILVSTLPTRTTLPFIVGLQGNTLSKIEGTTDGEVITWNETDGGFWEVGTVSGSDGNIYDNNGNITVPLRQMTIDSGVLKIDQTRTIFTGDTDFKFGSSLDFGNLDVGYTAISSTLQRISDDTDISGTLRVDPSGVILFAQSSLDGSAASTYVQLDTLGLYFSNGLKTIWYEETSGGNYTSFRSGSMTTNLEYIWPTDTPGDGEVLTWNTGDQLSWETAGGGGGGIYGGSDNIASGVTATLLEGDEFIFAYFNTNSAISIDDDGGEISLYSPNSNNYFRINDSRAFVSILDNKIDIDENKISFSADTGFVRLVLYEPNGSGSNYTEFTQPAMATSQTYILPSDAPNDGEALVWNTGGTLSWEAAGGADGNGIYDGDGTLQSGATEALLPAGAQLVVQYDGGNIGLSVSDATDEAYISGQSGTYTVYADNSNSGLTHATGGWLTGSTYALTGSASVASTNTVTDRLVIQGNVASTVASNGFGSGILFQGESSTTNDQDMARISAAWTTATHAGREAKIGIELGNNAGALAEIANFNVQNDAQGALSIGSSTPVLIYNDGITTQTSFTLGGTSSSLTLGGSSGVVTISSSATGGITFNPSNVGSYIDVGNSVSHASSITDRGVMRFTNTWAPTSGSRFFKPIMIIPTINQTGTSTGNTWGIEIAPTLTALTGTYYAVDIAANHTSARGIYQSGSSTVNNFVGGIAAGTTSAPNASAQIDIVSTTKGLGIPSMTDAQRDAISSPREGLVVYTTDQDALSLRDNGIWKRLPTTRTVLKTADETVNNSSTYQTDDALTFTAKANKKYVVKYYISLNDPNNDVATGGTKFKVTASGATTVKYYAELSNLVFGATYSNNPHSDNAADIYCADAFASYTDDFMYVQMTAYINPGASDRTVNLEWAQINANANNTKILEGSFLEYEEIN